jgi:hypothetical protein
MNFFLFILQLNNTLYLDFKIKLFNPSTLQHAFEQTNGMQRTNTDLKPHNP